jgi:hypothetical protein
MIPNGCVVQEGANAAINRKKGVQKSALFDPIALFLF